MLWLYKNIIFDFDGVIINSHDVQVKALKDSYRAICGEGIPPYDDFFKLSGNSLKNIFTQLGLPLDMIPIYQKISRENISSIKIHEGMIELLQKLNEKDYNCAICTGKDRNRTLEILSYFHMTHLFKIVICSDDVINPKPHPESLIFIMDQLGASPENTVMIGDGINDILSAKNVGIESIAITWGDVIATDLIDICPDYICNSIENLRKYFY